MDDDLDINPNNNMLSGDNNDSGNNDSDNNKGFYHQDNYERKAYVLGVISLLCGILGVVLVNMAPSISEPIRYLVGPFGTFLIHAALILMVIVRVKYPRNWLGIVLMIIYCIVLFFYGAYLFILSAIDAMCNDCFDSCSGCANMGFILGKF